MAWSSTACATATFLKLTPPPPSTRSPPQPQHIPRGRSNEESPESFVRRKLCAAGAATMVVIGLGGGYGCDLDAVALVKPERSPNEIPRWSDRIQGCPPWRSNSLQVVVPENLPRPSARRRWESVRNPGSDAPTATSSTTTTDTKPVGRTPGCFSM